MKIHGVSEQVQRVMDGTAITMEELQVMVDRAAIVTHPSGCNRRYHSWLMDVRQDSVLYLRKLEMTDYSQGCRAVEEDCEGCWGDGCAECGWIGRVLRLA